MPLFGAEIKDRRQAVAQVLRAFPAGRQGFDWAREGLAQWRHERTDEPWGRVQEHLPGKAGDRLMRKMKVQACIKPNPARQRKKHYDRQRCKHRNVIERFFRRSKRCAGLTAVA